MSDDHLTRKFTKIFAEASSGAQREGMVMEPYHLIPIEPLRAYARVSNFGAKKYTNYNWEKGLPNTQIARSLIDHIFAYMRGEDTDHESGLSITDHIVWNAAALSYNQAHGICDDRPKEKPPLHGKSHETELWVMGIGYHKDGTIINHGREGRND